MITSILIGTALAATPGDPVDYAAAVHVSPDGFAAIATGVAGILPSSIAIPSFEGEFECEPGGDPLTFGINELDLSLLVDGATLIPSDGRLDLDLDLGLIVEAQGASLGGSCTFLLQDISQECAVSIGRPDPIDLTLHLGIELSMDAEGMFDVTVDSVDYTLGVIPNPLSEHPDAPNACAIAGVFDALMSPGLSPNLITDLIAETLDPALADIGPSIEQPLEDALAFLPLVTSIDLLGAPLDVELYASDFILDEAGLLIGLGASLTAPWDATCVTDGTNDDGEPLPPLGPDPVAEAWPPVGNTAYDGGGTPYDAALLLNADVVDTALYTVWQAGLLCVDVPSLSPIDITTDLLGTLFGDDYQALYEDESFSADLFLSSDAPPTAAFDNDQLLGIQLAGLHLDSYSPLEKRKTRICRTDLDAEATLDATLADSVLSLGLTLDPASWTFTEPTHEILPPGYSDGLATGLPSLIGSFLPADLLPSFPLPSFQGIGVGDLVVEPDADKQWQGLFLTLDINPEPIVLEGCEGGCNDSGGVDFDLESLVGCDAGDDGGCAGCGDTGDGCDSGGGCTTPGRGGGRVALVLFALAFAGLRRRRA